MKTLTKQIAGKLLRTRKEDSNKGDHGHALLICGSQGLMGSAVISTRACLRTGCGLLTVNIPKDERFIIQSTIPEAMVQFRENTIIDISNFSAIGIGPGIGKSEESQKLVSTILHKYKNPILLDADALNIISDNKKLLKIFHTKLFLLRTRKSLTVFLVITIRMKKELILPLPKQ